MYLKAATLDDLLMRVFKKILKNGVHLTATKGANAEITGVALELTQPRARLSRTEVKGTIFSCLGEFLWYASSSNDASQMEYYLSRYKDFAENNGTVWGAYGPRMFEGARSQYDVVLATLRKKATSRQAVIQLFDRKDILKKRKDVPCTCTLQFLQRNGFLHLIVHMRSNDAYWGLPHDVFTFTMIQEIVANELGYKLGKYKHLVGSLHVYDKFRDQVDLYLKEGLQPTAAMPAMPAGDQWPEIRQLIAIEKHLRSERAAGVEGAITAAAPLAPFWGDMARLLSIYALTKGYDGKAEKLRQVVKLQNEMSSPYYRTYIRRRHKAAERAHEQLSLLEVGKEEDQESPIATS